MSDLARHVTQISLTPSRTHHLRNLFALQSKQPTQRFSESVARHYGAEIFLALEHLHSHSIAFRDLKPENVLVDARGQHVSLTDFGLAHVVTDYERLESFVGTPEYMAPEIFTDEVGGCRNIVPHYLPGRQLVS